MPSTSPTEMTDDDETARRTALHRRAFQLDAIGRLAGGVAHDFNNILTVIQSYACLLEEALEDRDARREDAAEVRRAAERGTQLTRQLTAMSHKGPNAPRPLDIDDVIRSFLPMMRRLAGPSVAIVHRPGARASVLADEGQVEQVLMNLVVNARDAMPDGGRLVIETSTVTLDDEAAAARGLPAGRHVELSVTDSGVGMDASTCARIFEPHLAAGEAGDGAGLGLSVVRDLVAGAGGATRVYSERGFGTTVRLAFPALEGRPALSPGELVAPPRRLPALGVLVVDDDDEVRAVAVRILRDAGCVVVDAATANEARRICVSHEGKLDLALVDLVLRDGRGDLLIDELRALRPGLTFLMTSGYPAGALEERGAASAEVVPKPFTPGELRVAAARACGVTGGDEPPFVPAAVRRLALVVDDDAPLRRTVVRVLRGAGFDCAEAADGAAAMTAVEDQRFDVVISDVNMPGGTGLDLLRAVRRVDLDVPIVLMTGEPSIGAAATAVQFGAFRYLTKPFDLDELARTAQEAARAHALARIRREAYAVTGMRAALTDRAGLEVRFQQAMERAWIAFQPIVYATSGAIHGVEALMRSVEPSLPTPDAVLAAAASLGRLPLLGRHLRGLAAAGMAGSAASHLLFVNLHPDDLMDAELVDPSSPLYAMAPRVVLEVTERAPLDVSAELHQRLDRLRSLGFRIAVDDVGAGYSGLSTFTELAPDLVKIDMSLVRDVHTNVLKQRTIAALCHLCHEGGTLVVGEGVETRDERDALIDLGCDLLQGHLLGYPSRDLPA